MQSADPFACVHRIAVGKMSTGLAWLEEPMAVREGCGFSAVRCSRFMEDVTHMVPHCIFADEECDADLPVRFSFRDIFEHLHLSFRKTGGIPINSSPGQLFHRVFDEFHMPKLSVFCWMQVPT